MNYTLQVFDLNPQQIQFLQQLQEKQKQEAVVLLKTTTRTKNRNCKQCHKLFTVKFPCIKTQFCSKKCYHEYRTYTYKCIGCQTIFQTKNTQNPKFCTQKCYLENKSNLCKPTVYRYDRYYYCDSCLKWILHEDAIIINKKPTCYKLDCKNNRLKTKSTKSKLNQGRKNVKWIE